MSSYSIRSTSISRLIKKLQAIEKEHGDLYCQGINPSMIDRFSNPSSEDDIQLIVEQIYPHEDYKNDLVVKIIT